MNHHQHPITSSTERSSVNILGNTEAPTAKIPASTAEARVEKVARHATDLACASCPARAPPPPATARRLQQISTSARKFHNCSTTWLAATAAAPDRAATAPADAEQGLERHRAKHQIATHHDLGPQHRRLDPQRHPLGEQQHARNSRAATRLARRVHTQPASSSLGMPSQPYTSSGHSARTPRTRRRRSAAAVRCPARRASSRCPPPRSGSQARPRSRCAPMATLLRRCLHRRPAPTPRAPRRPRPRRQSARPGQGQPGGLHAFPNGRRAVAHPEEPRRARGRAVGQEGHLRAEHAQNQPADGQAGKRQCAQPSDDGHVEEQIDRFGGQHPERREGQRGDAPAGGRGDPGRPAQPRAVYSACTTSSADPVAE